MTMVFHELLLALPFVAVCNMRAREGECAVLESYAYGMYAGLMASF